MNPNLFIDITQIPAKLAGLKAVTLAIAVALLAFIIPFTLVEMNIRGLKAREYPSYSGFLTRLLTVGICLIGYGNIFSFILTVSQMLSFSILSEQDWGNFLTQTLRGGDSTFPTLSILFHSVTSIQSFVLFLSSLIAVTARDVIVILQACFLSLLYAFGPIAVACGVNQKSAQVTRGWLANTIQVALWSFFLRLAVRVWLALTPLNQMGQGLANDYLGILTVNVTFILLLLGTPIVAARLISGENLAIFAEASMAAVQSIVIAKSMRAGSFVSREVGKYQAAKAGNQADFFHHPLMHSAATMTAAAKKMFSNTSKVGAGYEPFSGPSKK